MKPLYKLPAAVLTVAGFVVLFALSVNHYRNQPPAPQLITVRDATADKQTAVDTVTGKLNATTGQLTATQTKLGVACERLVKLKVVIPECQ